MNKCGCLALQPDGELPRCDAQGLPTALALRAPIAIVPDRHRTETYAVIESGYAPGSFGQQELPVTPDAIFANANLAALANNGGPTTTMALLLPSPAINAGTATSAPSLDQRGYPRVAAVDIGAYEEQFDVLFSNGFE